MKIVLIGMKGCGKTTIGMSLAKQLQVSFIDSDVAVEKVHKEDSGEAISVQGILKKYGEKYFNALETRTVECIAKEYGHTNFVFACGGRTPLGEENRAILAGLGTIIFLRVETAVLLKRIRTQGIPAFFPYQDDPEKSLDELLAKRMPVYEKLAHLTIYVGEDTTEEVIAAILKELGDHGEN